MVALAQTACDAAVGVLGQESIEHGVRHLVAQLICERDRDEVTIRTEKTADIDDSKRRLR